MAVDLPVEPTDTSVAQLLWHALPCPPPSYCLQRKYSRFFMIRAQISKQIIEELPWGLLTIIDCIKSTDEELNENGKGSNPANNNETWRHSIIERFFFQKSSSSPNTSIFVE
jgi:hypothetical protein